ncbi:hypothetical protein GCM10010917_09780 [Paenibacillus physcomitrellae]|uniref:Uncharacterized protein n=1 Tax=Paenibacillus physcomitrellae TaxID=1619311 RepID=A0ABQ1FSU5_9BACL|nr:hypothetical protein GCM10010917_09780 [Paenibacillus physcomitrellae]
MNKLLPFVYAHFPRNTIKTKYNTGYREAALSDYFQSEFQFFGVQSPLNYLP